jgi:multidrug efflux pump subunit AcrA (membrane-fusion protein)
MASLDKFRPWRWWAAGIVAIVLTGVAAVGLTSGGPPSLSTAEVTRGDFVELVEIRGDVRPFRSVVVTAPFQAGELQILKLAATGDTVKKGDVVAEFDALTLRNTLQDKQSELRQAEAERDQAREQAKSDAERDRTAVLKADFDVRREKLNVGDPSILPASDVERTRLAIGDAEQRLKEAQEKDEANRRAAAADASARDRKVAKIKNDIEIAERGLGSLKSVAPSDGTVNVMPNWRNSSPMGPAQEFRAGDKAWAGAQILELPDLSSVQIMSRIDESDRGQLKIGQTATVRVEAVPDREYHATIADISVLARVDFSSGWPPAKNFDLVLSITDADGRLRPGMSAAVRIATGKIPDMLLVPTASLFPADGRLVVYRRGRRQYEAVPVEIVRRGREQVAVKAALAPGDHVSLVKPPTDNKSGGKTP